MSTPPRAGQIRFADLEAALRSGLRTFRQMPMVSAAYASVFALIGLVLLGAIAVLGVSPLALPFAGGFMLVGPVLVAGYFELASRQERGEAPRVLDAFGAFRRAPAGLWLLALLCAFLFLIWITDAGILYSFTLAGQHLPISLGWGPEQRTQAAGFVLWASLMGAVLAYMIYAVSAFAVPLIYEERSDTVRAVELSVRTVLGSFFVSLAWGLILSGVILVSILVLPLLLVSLPVMAYASFALYRRAFPTGSETGGAPAGVTERDHWLSEEGH